MKLRVARHTDNIESITRFYRDILGLELLGKFNDHDGYDGVFLGCKNADWHLEFTTSHEPPKHMPDEDDLLVFYPVSIDEFNTIINRLTANSVKEEEPKNPYWKQNSIMISDPDGFGTIIVKL